MPPLPYLDFTLRLRPDSREGAMALVVHSAAGGGGSSSPRLPLAPNELNLILGMLGRGVRDPDSREWEPTGPLTVDDLMEKPTAAGLGQLLSEQIFQGRVRDAFLKSRAVATAGGHQGLRLRLVFDLEDSDGEGEEATAFRRQALALAALPWELIFDPETRRPLARNRETPVVRVLGVRAEAPRPPIEAPLRVLLATASPEALAPFDFHREVGLLREALEGRGIEVELLEHARFGALRAAVSQGDFHVLHFIGHGDFDHHGRGVLAFEGANAEADLVPGQLIAEALRGPSLHLVTVSACRSAQFPRHHGLDPYTGVATALVEAGVPAVIAMQFPITDGAARAFSTAFYSALAAGAGPEKATTEGRLAVIDADRSSREWSIPVLFLPLGGEPVLQGLASIVRIPEEIRTEIRPEETYIEAKTAGFVGRQFVRDAFEGFIRRHSQGYFLLLGDPGIGKTAFVADLVRSRRCPHHFNKRSEGVVQPEAFLRNLCAQLIVERRLDYQSLPPRAGRDAGFLNELLRQAATGLKQGEKLLIAVDALDESDLDSLPRGANPLYLPTHLPAGVFFLLSSRDVLRNPHADVPLLPYPLDPILKENLADIRELVGDHLGLQGVQDYLREQSLTEASFVEVMAERSEGNFMYLHHVLPAIERGEFHGDGLEAIPKGLYGYYETNWQRMLLKDEEAWFSLGLPVLHLITVAKLPLSAELINRYLDNPGLARVRSVLRQWQQFLHRTVARDRDGKTVKQYSLYHTGFLKFIEHQDEVRDQGPSLQEARENLLLHLLDDRDPDLSEE